MATMQGDKIIGTIGGLIYYFDPVRKKVVVRHKPEKVRNPRSSAQQAHRNSFIDIVRLSSRMTEAHLVGLHHHAQRLKLRTYTDFRHLNKDSFTPDGLIDYPRIVLSRGPVATVSVNKVQLHDNGVLQIDFDPCLTMGKAAPDDALYLYVYKADQELGCLLPPVLRSDKTLAIQLPAEWLQTEGASTDALTQSHIPAIHLYAFLRNRRGLTSDTIYIPLR